jgi:hypothetical protein
MLSGKAGQSLKHSTAALSSTQDQPYLASSLQLNTRSSQSKGRDRGPSERPRLWNASFINRRSTNVADFNTYDFSRPAANMSLGGRGSEGKIAAQLKVDLGTGRPTKGVQSDNFAMQAWTRVKLKEGRFYKVSSDSNDGTRFFFRDRQSGETLTTLSGDWRNRSASDPEWSKFISVPKGGKYDFFVQYYEKSGQSTINVKLEEVEQTGRVLSSGGLNVRSLPSTTGNEPFRRLDANETFKIRKQVKSTADANYPDWYEIETRDGKKGFVAAAAGLSEIVDKDRIVTFGTSDMISEPPKKPTTQNPGGGFTPSTGTIPSKGVVKGGTISFRTQPGTTASLVGDLSNTTALTITEKVTGDKYYVDDVPYDQWYKVKNASGQVGYVAAYYVNGGDNGGRYSSALNPKSTYYGEHLAAANPYKAAVVEAAAPYSAWLKPSILAAIGSRESGWGLFLDSEGKGDNGYGHGIMQIDSDSHAAFLAKGTWRDPGANIQYAVDNVLAEYYQYLGENTSLKGFDLLRGALAAYNAGPGNVIAALNRGEDVDFFTTGKDYSWQVIQRAGWFQDNGWA